MQTDPWAVCEEDFPGHAALADRLRFVVRYAVLAPSSRNSQPWRFEVSDRRIGLYADLTRRAQTADPYGRDLYISLGCALENLLVAAAQFGLKREIAYFPLSEEDELVAQITFADDAGGGVRSRSPLFDAITRRRTHHGRYDGRALAPAVLGKLNECCTEPGLTLLLTQEPAIKQAVEKMVLRAHATAFEDADYRRELAHAVGAGGYGASGVAARVQELVIRQFDVGKMVARQDHVLLESTPVFGLISAAKGGRRAQLLAGRLLERLYLAATGLGLCMQPLSVRLDFEEVTAAFARMFRAGGVPLMPFRLGYADPPARPTPRRPLEEVLR